MGWCKLKIVIIAVWSAVLAPTLALRTFAEPAARRCDAAYCYERICTPAPPSCRYVPNRVCHPTTKQECTTLEVKKCHSVPSNACGTNTSACHPHLKRTCGYASRYRTYAAEELSYYRRIPHLRPRQHHAASGACHLQVVRECSRAPRQACQQAHKEVCSYVPERSCHNRETQDCRDEPKYVCEKGPDQCHEQRVASAPAPSDAPAHKDGGGSYPPQDKTPAPHRSEKVPPPYREALPAPSPSERAPPLEPPPPAESNPPPPPSPKAAPAQLPPGAQGPARETRRELVIDVRSLMAPVAAGLATFGMLLLIASRRRKSQAKDGDPTQLFHIAYRGKPDPGTQAISHLSTAPVGRHITLRTVPGQRKVDITLD